MSSYPTTLSRKNNFEYTPSNLLIQWHITERCNLRCSHCYQNHDTHPELSLTQLVYLLEQVKNLLSVFEQRANRVISAHITVTGGEPLIRADFLDLLEIFTQHRTLFSFAILTNGCFIDATLARHLRQLAPRFVQVSIDGTMTTHDQIRGQGHFAQTVAAIKHLKREKIRTTIAFTAHRGNFREFPDVVSLAKQLGVDRVWADRLIPQGQGRHWHQPVMTPEETKEFFTLMAQEQNTAQRRWWWRRPEIAMHRALQFLVAGGRPYHCTAGDTLLTILPNGDLYPCRRMPLFIGNLLETPLLELYDNSPILHQLRSPQVISSDCQTCFYAKFCRGGLKCLAYALTGDPFQADPGCWLLAQNQASSVANKKILPPSPFSR
jgi:radical SAM protein with 4Fe4S-binding SPASM domain